MTEPTALQRLQARRVARVTALRGLPATLCPYRTDRTPAERVLVQVFIREYLRHRPPAPGTVDYDT